MSLDAFIPTIWSARLLDSLQAATVYLGLCAPASPQSRGSNPLFW